MFLSWMAWTLPTAIFFGVIACLLISFTVWEILKPGGGPRMGILGIETTRGDRLFVTLLGSAFIHLLWLAVTNWQLWIATIICFAWAFFVFRKV